MAYIVGRRFDLAAFLLSPLLALAIALVVHHGLGRLAVGEARADKLFTLYAFLPLTVGHQSVTFLRSHTHPDIRRQYAARLFVLPIVLVAALALSDVLFATAAVAAALWQIYHYAAQNFGLCRIYEIRAGNDPMRFRKLDLWLAIYLYTIPYVAVTGAAAELRGLDQVTASLGLAAYDRADLVYGTRYLAGALFLVGIVIPLRYAFAVRDAARAGYRMPQTKQLFLASLFASVTLALFVSPVVGVLSSTILHSIQYYALVDTNERKRGNPLLKLPLVLVAVGWLCGAFFDHASRSDHASMLWRYGASVGVVVTLLHFYYDGFIWSVRKRQVA